MKRVRERVTETFDGGLLDRIKLSTGAAYVGQPVAVEAVITDECSHSTVTINDAPGREHLIQFAKPGTKRVSVTVVDDQGRVDHRSVPVAIEPRPADCDGGSLYPLIEIEQNFRRDSGASFSLGNEDEFAAHEERVGTELRYVWEIAGDERYTTTQPSFEYSFEDHLGASDEYETFDVRLHVKDGDGRLAFTGARTVGVWNTYVLSKEQGVIQPSVDPNIYARRDGDDYVGTFEITNRERESIQFDSVQVAFLTDDTTRATTPSDHEKHSWTLEGETTEERTFEIDADRLPDDAFGFAAHFHGDTRRSDVDVIASAYFEVRSNPRTDIQITDPALVGVLDAVRGRGHFQDGTSIPLDALTTELERKPDCVLPDDTGRDEAVDAKWVTRKVVEAAAAAEYTPPLVDDGGDVIGEECIPGETPPEDDLVCQLTDEVRWVMVPGRVLNARKGDVLLSPGGNGAIGGLLKQVTPPQVYSHSGIMIQNHYRLRHSTASTDWLENATAGIDGSEGLDPDKLKYAWPGTIDQSIVEAYEGSTMADPDGETDDSGSVIEYEIDHFSNSTTLASGIGLVDPRVVKPDPSSEASMPAVREHLHRIADSASAIDGHYRFYAYTDANAFFDDSRQAPDRGSSWWASNTRPTVCSSLVWAAAERLEDPEIALESTEEFTPDHDLEPDDVADGAEVDFQTRDGLYYYTETERYVAAQWLHDHFANLVADKLAEEYGIFGGAVGWITDAADDLADQMCNTFGFDWSGENEAGDHAKDSNRWETPSDGHAVSPDDIMNYWDAPTRDGDRVQGVYGYSEPLVYRSARLERRRVATWQRAPPEEAEIDGRVVFRGDGVSGAHVSAAGEEDLTDGSGRFDLTLPAGTHRVDAGKYIDGFYAEGHEIVELGEGEEETVDIVLDEPDELFRSIDVRGTMDIVDDEAWPWDNETANRDFFIGDVRVGPYGTHATRYHDERMGGEVRVEVHLTFDWQLDASVDIAYTAHLYEGTSESTGDLEDTETGNISVGADDTESHSIELVNTEFAGGDTADIGLQISNDRQP